MSKYSVNDITMIMYFCRDNEKFTQENILSYQQKMDLYHSLDSLKMKILDVSSCLHYQIHNNLIDIEIKYQKYNKHIGKYKQYSRGIMKQSLDVFLQLNNRTFQNIDGHILYNFFRNCVSNSYSKEYIENKLFQSNFIESKINNTNMFDENRFMDIDITENTFDKVYHSINPWLRNIVLQFFNYKKSDKICNLCHHNQIERCHQNDRKNVLKNVIIKHNLNDKKINIGRLLKLFILEHKDQPLWIFCKNCHKFYDKIYKKL